MTWQKKSKPNLGDLNQKRGRILGQIVFRPALPKHLDQWDEFVSRAVNGTMFHSRAFLGYHEDKFADTARWMIATRRDDVIALFAYAVDEQPDGRHVARSPFGASYGGLIVKEPPSYRTARNLVAALISHLREEALDGLHITTPISCCAPSSLDTLTFALLEQGFRSVCRDVSSVVPIDHLTPVWETVTSRVRRNTRKALANGIVVELGAQEEDFWVPMRETFFRHGTRPTHDQAQLATLIKRVPGRIRLDVGYRNDAPMAGVALFVVNARVVCSFYLCQTKEAKPLQSLTLTVLRSMERCQADGFVYYDMGTSSVNMRARENIFRFKEGFSAEGYIRETFEWDADM